MGNMMIDYKTHFASKAQLIQEARTISETLHNTFHEFQRFNSSTFHENYHRDFETLISQIEPLHFTKSNPTLFKIAEQAFSEVNVLKQYIDERADVTKIYSIITSLEQLDSNDVTSLVKELEKLAIEAYNSKARLQDAGYSADSFFRLLATIASVRKEYSEKKMKLNNRVMQEKISLLEKEVIRIKIAAHVIFAQKPTKLASFKHQLPLMGNSDLISAK